ncbi:MAG TPA: DUF5663 domain-containing protein [bacterium]|nr:DUF5663 domain-containing protein [bacterium]
MNTLNENSTELNPLVEGLIDRFNLRNLPEEDLNEFRVNLEQQISRRLGLVILENLSEEGLKEYEESLSDILIPDPEKISEITKKYIPDLDQKIKISMEEFIKEVEQSLTK